MKDVLKRAKELDERIARTDADVGKSIDNLIKASKTNRRLINWVIVSIAFETVLAAAVIFVVFRTNRNAIRIEQTRNTLINNCVVGNEFRATEKTFWNYVLSLAPPGQPEPEQQARIDAFKAKLDETFAPRPCNQL